MTLSKKLVVPFVVILLLVTGFELVYIFYPQLFVTLTSCFQKNEKTKDLSSTENKELIATEQAIDPSILSDMAYLKRDIVTSAALNLTYTGVLDELKIGKGKLVYSGGHTLNFILTLSIRGYSGDKNTLFYTQSQVTAMHVYREENGTSFPIKLTDLHKGDKITVNEARNIKLPPESQLIDITIIQD